MYKVKKLKSKRMGLITNPKVEPAVNEAPDGAVPAEEKNVEGLPHEDLNVVLENAGLKINKEEPVKEPPVKPTNFVIDEEVKNRINALTIEEREILEANIDRDGCRDALVIAYIVAENLLVLGDGHNRYDYCTRKNIPYTTVELSFATREDLLIWVDDNQLGKRNLTVDQKAIIIGRRYNRLKGKRGGDKKSKGQDVPPTGDIAKNFAKKYHVDQKTIKRFGTKATKYEKIEKDSPEDAKAIFAGLMKISEYEKSTDVKKPTEKESCTKTPAKKPSAYLDELYEMEMLSAPVISAIRYARKQVRDLEKKITPATKDAIQIDIDKIKNSLKDSFFELVDNGE